jgi:ketosteroid isomerase-like protein
VTSDRAQVEQVLHELYAARVSGQLGPLCELFDEHARFRIAGSGDRSPIAIEAKGVGEIRPWLSLLVKTFRLTNFETLAVVIDAPRAAVQWRADIHSRITGVVVSTELLDLLEISAGRIVSYVELFVPR